MGIDSNSDGSCITPDTKPITESFTVEFYFCTSKIGICAEIKSLSTIKNLEAYGFRSNYPTYVLIHGFLRTHETYWVQETMNELKKQVNANVFLVDWSSVYLRRNTMWTLDALDRLNYKKAVQASKVIAGEVAKFFKTCPKKLDRKGKKRWYYMHFIGHSLGAHIAGQAARKLGGVDRVTGLDPAGPCFDGVKTELKLSRTDAMFVDIIHTNSAKGEKNNFGIYEPIGKIDFYPNGGNRQPRCVHQLPDAYNLINTTITKAIIAQQASIHHKRIDGDIPHLTDLVTNFVERGPDMFCDHEESTRYFIDSIKGQEENIFDGLPFSNDHTGGSNKLTTCVEMGIDADTFPNAEGSFLVNVDRKVRVCPASGKNTFRKASQKFKSRR
ncbi:hypothetical protein QAD02_010757 [Eretmocerus hayati]|uniref:Uncharacterized protein n=1 Tax=Eretmocerus hayati TaxID=131215 RepID=A0ACC2NVY9_9HYME|nr:hypothetical protein QAD02_010757 [Eretmocerus hayati]